MCVKLLSGFFGICIRGLLSFQLCVCGRERSEVLNRAVVSNFL